MPVRNDLCIGTPPLVRIGGNLSDGGEPGKRRDCLPAVGRLQQQLLRGLSLESLRSHVRGIRDDERGANEAEEGVNGPWAQRAPLKNLLRMFRRDGRNRSHRPEPKALQ
jgi:hypothetical protein